MLHMEPLSDRRADTVRRGGRRQTDDPAFACKVQLLQERALLDLAADVDSTRLQKGWSVERLAREAHLTEQTTSDVLRARIDPKLSTLIRLATAVGLRLSMAPVLLK